MLASEFLALMLAARRPGISLAAAALQKAGVIRYRQGHVTVLGRAGLETAVCECYGTVRERFEAMLGVPAGA